MLHYNHIQGPAEIISPHACGERSISTVLSEVLVFSYESFFDLFAHLNVVLRPIDYSNVA